MKKSFALFLSFTLVLGLAACAKTPDEALVAQKDKERLESIAAETAAKEDSLKTRKDNTPENYTFHYETEDRSLKITADVPITLPEKDTFSTYRAFSDSWSQEQVDRIYNYFFPDGNTYIFSGTDRTKSVIEASILDQKQIMAEVEAADNITEYTRSSSIEDIQSVIAELETEYKTAPEESTLKRIPVDSSLQEEEANDGFTFPALTCETEDGDKFWVHGNRLEYDRHAAGADYSCSFDTSAERASWQTTVNREQAIEFGEKTGISFEKAIETANQLFEAAGVEASLQQIYLIKGRLEEENRPHYNKYLDEHSIHTTWESTASAYQFTFFRALDGVDIVGDNRNRGVGDGMPYSISWIPETIDLIISSNGIEKLSWTDPLTIEEELSEDVGLLSFEEASSIFEKMMPVVYLGRLESGASEDWKKLYTIDVTDLKLCMMPIRDNGEESSGLLVPVWVFCGDWWVKSIPTDPGQSASSYLFDDAKPYVLIAINALDGTVIDLFEGY